MKGLTPCRAASGLYRQLKLASAEAEVRVCQLLGLKRWRTRLLERRSVINSKGVVMKEGVYWDIREVRDSGSMGV